MEFLIALVALTAMEIVLGIDNIVFVAIATGRLPPAQQPFARRLGLTLALVLRILLLLTLSSLLRLEKPLVTLDSLGVPQAWLEHAVPRGGDGHASGDSANADIQDEAWAEVNEISGKDLILLFGGLFLLWKSVHEIHAKFEEHHRPDLRGKTSFASALVQIAIMDIIFSIDSVITAIGMVRTDASNFWTGIGTMVTAVIIAVVVMLVFSERVSQFVELNPTLKVLALAFLILIGVMLVAEGIGTHFDKGYIYFAMAFALVVEMLNIRLQKSRHPSGTP